MRNHTLIGLEYIPWGSDSGGNGSSLTEPSVDHDPTITERYPHAVSAYAYSAAIIAVYAVVIVLLIVVQLRSRKKDPVEYLDEGYNNDEKELLEDEGEDEGRSLLRIDVEKMSGLKDAHNLDKMPSERV